jgi:hypothetical protein
MFLVDSRNVQTRGRSWLTRVRRRRISQVDSLDAKKEV